MLAYVFWHWPVPQIDALSYQERLLAFHRVLSEHKPEGFLHSSVLLLAEAPWLGRNTESYEDWYIVENSAALDPLDQAAVNGPRREPHNQVARWTEGGTAGLYRLRLGKVHLPSVSMAFRFAKPTTTNYDALYTTLQPLVEQTGGCLWVRQMTLGPAAEFCFLCPQDASMPDTLDYLKVAVKQIWSG
jgi:hypothetical protein